MSVDAIERIRSFFLGLIKNKQALIKILSITVILTLAFLLKIFKSESSDITIESPAENSDIQELVVDISGAVVNPGVYKVDAGTRLYEVIELAGGLKNDADTYSVNQAAYVEDGAKFIIPSISDNPEDMGERGSSRLININTASKEQLSSLSGVGDVIADRIIEYRASARFKSKEDIMSVKGIGKSIYQKIQDYITV